MRLLICFDCREYTQGLDKPPGIWLYKGGHTEHNHGRQYNSVAPVVSEHPLSLEQEQWLAKIIEE